MKKFPFSLLSALWVVTVLGLWFALDRTQSRSEELVRRLEASRSELSEALSLKEGLEEANDDLRARVARLREAPPLATLNTEEFEEVVPDEETLSVPEVRRGRPGRGEEEESRERTPEEMAEREEREERRRQWEEERRQRRAEFRERVETELDHRKAFFAQISTEGLAPEYKQAHERLMVALDEVGEKMAAVTEEDLSRRERWQMMREMRSDARELSDLMDMQRDVLLNDYAQQALGMDNDEVRDFIEYMKTVEEMTGVGGMMRGRGRGR